MPGCWLVFGKKESHSPTHSPDWLLLNCVISQSCGPIKEAYLNNIIVWDSSAYFAVWVQRKKKTEAVCLLPPCGPGWIGAVWRFLLSRKYHPSGNFFPSGFSRGTSTDRRRRIYREGGRIISTLTWTESKQSHTCNYAWRMPPKDPFRESFLVSGLFFVFRIFIVNCVECVVPAKDQRGRPFNQPAGWSERWITWMFMIVICYFIVF